MRRMRRALCLLLGILFLLSLCACGARRGRTERYDGYTVRTEKESAPTELPERETPDRASPDEAEADYVLNRKSMKFHYPDCSGAKEIKDTNRWNYHGTRQSVIDMGYVPCRLCNP